MCAGLRGLWLVVANLWTLIIMLLTPSYAVNLNLNLNMVLAPNQTQLNFGSSVAFWRTEGEMNLVIGAPLTPYEHQNMSYPLGNMFLCTLTGECEPFKHLPILDNNSMRALELGEEYFRQMGYGLGETVSFLTSTETTTDSILLACAPRFPKFVSPRIPSDHFPDVFMSRGACYMMTESRSKPEFIMPFTANYIGRRGTTKNTEKNTGFGIAGFSAALAKDETVIMGCPNTYYGQGSLASWNYIRSNHYNVNKNGLSSSMNDYNREGWALVLGKFSYETDLEYIATSVPDADNYYGQIKFYNKNFDKLEHRYFDEEASTHGFKSFYGYALAVGDLDQDGREDLIVGAPLARGKNEAVEGGKVFVYYGPLDKRLQRKTQIIEGPTAWSRFGSAVVSDDFNHDGFYDVAVGAPYSEQGWGGAVYIYMGGRDGLCTTMDGTCYTPALVICASDFSPPSPGFSGGANLQFLHTVSSASNKHCKVASSSPLLSLGYSLATADVDNNGYPDLLIGAPKADKALLIRSAPVVVLVGNIFFEPRRVLLGNTTCTVTHNTGTEKVTCFKLKINIQYEAHQLDIRNLSVIHKIKLDYKVANKRILFKWNNEAEIEWSGYVHKTEEAIISEVDVYVKPVDVDYVEAITASVTVQLADHPHQSSNRRHNMDPAPPLLYNPEHVFRAEGFLQSQPNVKIMEPNDRRQQMDPVPPLLYKPEGVFRAKHYQNYVEDCYSKEMCGDCIQTPNCKWCSQLSTSDKGKCFPADTDLIDKCANTSKYVENPKNQLTIIENINLTEANSEAEFPQELVQVKPQRFKLKLRKDVPVIITVKYRQAKDYPVDMYYLMDHSNSMRAAKETVVGLMSKMVDTLKKHTKQVRLGFGSFVDKVLLPFVDMSPAKLEQPCRGCIRPYSFKNNLPLSSDTDLLKEKAYKIQMSGNMDVPEGGFDALMQVMKCTDQVGWSDNAHRIIVLATDAPFHSAGDGRLAGIIERNDEQCHLNDQGEYTHYMKTDYPSIAQINKVAKEEQFNIIFAVSNYEELYALLSKEIESSSYGILINDSENIVQLVEDQYLAITSKVELKDNTEDMDGALNIEYFARCPGAPEHTFYKSNTCHNLQEGDEIEFILQVTLQKCPDERNFEVKVGTTGEKLVIEVETLCDCNC